MPQDLDNIRLRVTAGLLALVVALASLGLVVLSTPAGAASGSTIVSDNFRRTTHHGLGAAPVGGRYAVSANGRTGFAVASGRARITPIRANKVATATLGSVRARDVVATLRFSVSKMGRRGKGEYVAVETRHQSRGDAYRACVRVTPSGRLLVGLGRVRAGAVRDLVRAKQVRAVVRPGRQLELQTSVSGVSPVVVRVRVRVVGSATPAWQISVADHSAARITRAGALGIRAFTARTTPSAALALYTFVGRSLPTLAQVPSKPTPSAPPASSPSVPTATAPSTPNPPAPTPTAPTPTAPAPAPTAPALAPVPPATQARGSLPVGQSEYPIPAGALFVSSSAGDDAASGTVDRPLRTVKRALALSGSGQTIVLRAGDYHESLSLSRDRDVTIQAYPSEAVWFDGSSVVGNWTRQGAAWVSTGWTAQFDHSASFTKGSDAGNFVNSAYPMAAYPDMVFVDGTPLAQVAASTVPGPGQFSVGYDAKTLTIGTDPSGHEVRGSDLGQALVVGGRVTLRGLGIRRYATSLPQIGTVYLGGSVGHSVLENVVIADNATQGLSIGTHDVLVSHVTASGNGMTGIHSNNGTGSIVEDSRIVGNNADHFNSAPSAGGLKITRAGSFTIRNNDVIGNLGVTGIWLDVSVANFTIVGNTVTDNASVYGILTELSDTGIVANNTVSGSTRGFTAFDTGNVRVFNNLFSGATVWDVGVWQDARRNTGADAATIPWLSRNITVSNNLLMSSAASYQFYALDKQTNIPASAMNIVLDGDLFAVDDSARQAIMVGWGGADNVGVTAYRSPAELNAALGTQWRNEQMSTGADLAPPSTMAVPLPADIADAVGRLAGTRHIGTF